MARGDNDLRCALHTRSVTRSASCAKGDQQVTANNYEYGGLPETLCASDLDGLSTVQRDRLSCYERRFVGHEVPDEG